MDWFYISMVPHLLCDLSFNSVGMLVSLVSHVCLVLCNLLSLFVHLLTTILHWFHGSGFLLHLCTYAYLPCFTPLSHFLKLKELSFLQHSDQSYYILLIICSLFKISISIHIYFEFYIICRFFNVQYWFLYLSGFMFVVQNFSFNLVDMPVSLASHASHFL